MKRVLPVLFACQLFALCAQAQLSKTDDLRKSLETTDKDTVVWLHTALLNIGFNEGFLHNWAAGGEVASLTVNGQFQGNITRVFHRYVWSNDLTMAYGLYYAYSNSFVPRKTNDLIDYTSKIGYRMDTNKSFYLSGLFDFRSQFTKGYDYTMPVWDTMSTSNWFSPAYFTLAGGFEYREGSDLTLFLSPVAGRLTLASKYYTMQSPQGAFGIDYGKTSLYQFGAYFSGRFNRNINKRMTIFTRLDLYSNYLAKDTKDSTGNIIRKDNPGNIAVFWDNLFTWKVAKYFSLTFGATFIYDNSIPYSTTYVNGAGATVEKNVPGNNLGWMQIKQIFTFGFIYKLSR